LPFLAEVAIACSATTLIPLVAVPVPIIGTFAVMPIIGYSANTVSLLALVLAIGIVFDDAIVVVENVGRVMEENPELPPDRAGGRRRRLQPLSKSVAKRCSRSSFGDSASMPCSGWW